MGFISYNSAVLVVIENPQFKSVEGELQVQN